MSTEKKILVTGGAGYIGSHMCVELLQAGYEVVVIDNFSNSSPQALHAVEHITGKKLITCEADIRDADALRPIFDRNEFEAVLHFAGLKAVGDSSKYPAVYYDNNVVGALRLVESMRSQRRKKLVFSSSATVYGIPSQIPTTEESPTLPISPYGRTKRHIEEMLGDIAMSDPSWGISLLRYFNPTGAHPSGEIGEAPNGTPNNLIPFVSQVAVGRRDFVKVFGDDYPTPDGTGIRDYIHVRDLVHGHLKAMEYLDEHPGVHVHNLGTGRGHSVLEVVAAFAAASGREIPYKIVARREGDAAVSLADPAKAKLDLNWEAECDLQQMCEDAWRWQSTHPAGYG